MKNTNTKRFVSGFSAVAILAGCFCTALSAASAEEVPVYKQSAFYDFEGANDSVESLGIKTAVGDPGDTFELSAVSDDEKYVKGTKEFKVMDMNPFIDGVNTKKNYHYAAIPIGDEWYSGGYGDRTDLANTYAEIAFDFKSLDILKSNGGRIMKLGLVSSWKDTPDFGTGYLHMNFEGGQVKFYNNYGSTFNAGDFSNNPDHVFATLNDNSITGIDGEDLNIRLVLQLYDKDGKPFTGKNSLQGAKVTAVYINGKAMTLSSDPELLVWNGRTVTNHHSFDKLGISLGHRNENINAGFTVDNLSVISYQSSDGTSPYIDKSGLKAAIKEKAGTVNAEFLKGAGKVYTNPAASKADVETAETLLDAYKKFYNFEGANDSVESLKIKTYIDDGGAAFELSNVVEEEKYVKGTKEFKVTDTSPYMVSDETGGKNPPYIAFPMGETWYSDADNSNFSKPNLDKANTYTEIAFDFKSNDIIKSGGGELIKLSLIPNWLDDANQLKAGFLHLVYKKGQFTFYNSYNANDTTSVFENEAYQLATLRDESITDADGADLNIRLVIQLYDENGNAFTNLKTNLHQPGAKVTAIYINGQAMTMSSDPDLLVWNRTGGSNRAFDKLGITFSQYSRNISSGFNIDNLSFISYQSNDGTSPYVDKSGLKAAIKKNAGTADAETLNAAVELYNNPLASKAQVDAAAAKLDNAIEELIRREFTWDAVSSDQSIDGVTKDLTLPTTFASSVGNLDVIWSSSDKTFLSDTGKVIRPYSDRQVTLTATLVSGQYADIRVEVPFVVTILNDAAENKDLFSFSGLGFTDGDGQVSTVPRSGGKVSDVKVLSRGTEAGTVITAVYTADNTLYTLGMNKITPTAADEALSAPMNITLPTELAGCTIKVFVWNFDSIAPLMKVSTYNVNDYIAGDT